MPRPDPRTLPVPPGYKFRFEVSGDAAPGFAGDPDQTVLVYGRGSADVNYPLIVALSERSDVALIGTHGHAGHRVLLEDRSVEAIYHDGMWELSGDPAQGSTDLEQLRWNARDTHSITVRRPGGAGTVAVRGARSRDAAYDGLLRLIEHLAV